MCTAVCECVGRTRPGGPGDALLTMAANLRIQIPFTSTSGSWLNLVKIWFGIIERQAIHRGIFASVREVMIKIRPLINGWNVRCRPFIWTKTADQIFKKANRQTTQVGVHK